MSTFDDREQAYESMFAHDEELRFKAEVHQIKAMARWGAERAGQPDPDAYVQQFVERFLAGANANALLAQLRQAFVTHGTNVSDSEFNAAADRFRAEAMAHVRGH